MTTFSTTTITSMYTLPQVEGKTNFAAYQTAQTAQVAATQGIAQ